MPEKLLEKTSKPASLASGVSSGASFLSSYQVCHQVCMGLITVLSLVGISVVGMPLAFLLPYALPFWIAGIVLLGVTLALYQRMPHCISKNLIMLNAGLLVIAIPFKEIEFLQPAFWLTGSVLILLAIYSHVKNHRL